MILTFLDYMFRKYGQEGDPDGLMFAAADFYAAQVVKLEEQKIYSKNKKSRHLTVN